MYEKGFCPTAAFNKLESKIVYFFVLTVYLNQNEQTIFLFSMYIIGDTNYVNIYLGDENIKGKKEYTIKNQP